MLWYCNHITASNPNITPPWRLRQNQGLNLAPARRAAPIVATALNATMPTIEFGTPSTDDCGLLIIDPHEMIGLMSHIAAADGFVNRAIFSTVRATESNTPIVPPISSRYGKNLSSDQLCRLIYLPAFANASSSSFTNASYVFPGFAIFLLFNKKVGVPVASISRAS